MWHTIPVDRLPPSQSHVAHCGFWSAKYQRGFQPNLRVELHDARVFCIFPASRNWNQRRSAKHTPEVRSTFRITYAWRKEWDRGIPTKAIDENYEYATNFERRQQAKNSLGEEDTSSDKDLPKLLKRPVISDMLIQETWGNEKGFTVHPQAIDTFEKNKTSSRGLKKSARRKREPKYTKLLTQPPPPAQQHGKQSKNTSMAGKNNQKKAKLGSKERSMPSTRVSVRFIRDDGAILLLRDTRSSAIKNEVQGGWQLPTLKVLESASPLTQVLRICEGILQPRPKGSNRIRVLHNAFYSTRQDDTPKLVLFFDVPANETDVAEEAGLTSDEIMWIPQADFESNHSHVLKAMNSKCHWKVIKNGRRMRFISRMQQEMSSGGAKGALSHNFVNVLPFSGISLFRTLKQTQSLQTVAVAVWDPDKGQVLVARRDGSRRKARPHTQNVKDVWEWPGGKLENGETHQEAAVREIKEELNLCLQPEDLQNATFLCKPWFNRHLIRVLFTVTKFSGTAKAMEGQSWRWIEVEKLRNTKRFKFCEGESHFTNWVIRRYGKN